MWTNIRRVSDFDHFQLDNATYVVDEDTKCSTQIDPTFRSNAVFGPFDSGRTITLQNAYPSEKALCLCYKDNMIIVVSISLLALLNVVVCACQIHKKRS